MTTPTRPPGRPHGSTQQPGTQRTKGRSPRLSLREWAALCGPHRRGEESDSSLVVRLLCDKHRVGDETDAAVVGRLLGEGE